MKEGHVTLPHKSADFDQYMKSVKCSTFDQTKCDDMQYFSKINGIRRTDRQTDNL